MAFDLEMKIRMIHKYEGGQSLSAIAHELSFVVSTVNPAVKDAPHVKKHVSFIFHLINVCLSISSVI
jgi:hypothetical protein